MADVLKAPRSAESKRALAFFFVNCSPDWFLDMPTSESDYRSPLEQHPDYVHAIGMISIEHASLETLLGDLLGVLLGIHPHIGTTLYFTPKAATARLELIKNIRVMSTVSGTDLVQKVDVIITRSSAVMGKRNDIIHSLWSVNDEEEGVEAPVVKITFPKFDGGDVKLQQLKDVVRDYRRLIVDVKELILLVQKARGLELEEPEG